MIVSALKKWEPGRGLGSATVGMGVCGIPSLNGTGREGLPGEASFERSERRWAKHSLEGRHPRQRERLVQRPWRSVCAWESEPTAVNDAGGWWDQSYKAGGTFWALKAISKALALLSVKKGKPSWGFEQKDGMIWLLTRLLCLKNSKRGTKVEVSRPVSKQQSWWKMVVAQTKVVAVEVVKSGQILNIVKVKQVRFPDRLK